MVHNRLERLQDQSPQLWPHEQLFLGASHPAASILYWWDRTPGSLNCLTRLNIVNSFRKKSKLTTAYWLCFTITCHQNLVVDVGPTETGANGWQLSSIDPFRCSLKQELSWDDIAMKESSRYKENLKDLYVHVSIEYYWHHFAIITLAPSSLW